MICWGVVLRVSVGRAHPYSEWLLGFLGMETVKIGSPVPNRPNFCLPWALSTSASWSRDAQGRFGVSVSIASWGGVSGICLQSEIASRFSRGPS